MNRVFSLGAFFLLCWKISLYCSVNYNVYDPDTLSFNAGLTNEVRRVMQYILIKTATDYTLLVDDGTRSVAAEAVIVGSELADITVDTKTVTKTHAEVEQAGKLSLNFNISSIPNPEALGGYRVYLQVLNVSVNAIGISEQYLQFQTNAVTTDQSQLLYFMINNPKSPIYTWYTLNNAILMTKDWTSDAFIQVDDSFGKYKKTTETMNFTMTHANLDVLPVGQYVFLINMAMNPYTPPGLTAEIIEYENLVDLQSAVFASTLANLDADLVNQYGVYNFTAQQNLQLVENRQKVRKAYVVFLKAAKGQYQSYADDPDATTSQVQDLNQRIAVINAEIAVLNQLIASG